MIPLPKINHHGHLSHQSAVANLSWKANGHGKSQEQFYPISGLTIGLWRNDDNISAREGFLIIPQGKSSATLEDYHEHNLVIRSHDNNSWPSVMKTSQTEKYSKRPDSISLTIDKCCFNCTITAVLKTINKTGKSPGKFMMLNQSPADAQDRKNMSGINFFYFWHKWRKWQILTFDGFPETANHSGQNTPYTIYN